MFLIWLGDDDSIESLLKAFNSVYPTIKVTLEKEKNKSLPFLDLMISRGYGSHLSFDVYAKKSTVLTPIPAQSAHPDSSKKAFFRSHINRAITHTTFKFQETRELNKIIKLAKTSGYTAKWIRNLINKTIEPATHITSLSPITNNPTPKKYIPAVPYSKHFISIAKYLKRNFNLILPFSAPNTTSNIIVSDRSKTESSGGVYAIKILTEEGNIVKYIGQTCRKLNLRITEHKKAEDNIYSNTALKTFLKTHPKAKPLWNEVDILAAPKNHLQLLVRESIEISRSSEAINAKEGSDLSPIWTQLMEQEDTNKTKQNSARALRTEDALT